MLIKKVKKVTYVREFGYLNSSFIRKSIISMFLSSSRENFTPLYQVSVGFRPPYCRHTNLYQFSFKISAYLA